MFVRSVALAAVLAGCLRVAPAAPLVPAFERFGAGESSGQLLASELNCTSCHASEDIKPKGAPSLDGVGGRMQAEWIRAFLSDPQATKPGTTMPDLLAALPADERAQRVEELVHFLKSEAIWQAPKLAKHSSPHTGGRLFSRIGCAACHADPITTQYGSQHRAAGLVSLEGMRAKYSFPSLADFVVRPLHYRKGGRMPDMELPLGQAADIAAYLLDTLDVVENGKRAPLQTFAVDADKAARGRVVFDRIGCANCHPLEGGSSKLEVTPFETGGDCSHADYSLSLEQREALAGSPQPLDIAQRVELEMARMNCYACHARDGEGGPSALTKSAFGGDETLGVEGRFPPHLSGVGAKLKSDWLAKVLSGAGDVRPYLHTRMPRFGEQNVGHLVEWFALADRPEADVEELPEGDPDAGRILLGTAGGVGCITCHGVKGRSGLAMRALTLDGATGRYHPHWFRQNLIDPMATRPGTLMPSFWPGGVAGNREVLGGDTERQIAAIWAFLDRGEGEPPGFPAVEEGEFEIVPEGRPVIQRAMMDKVGAQAVAVGFPEGVHFVFDAESCRVAAVWRGRFIDGYNAWFSRREPVAEPLGEDVRFHPPTPWDRSRHFRGYRIDEGGVPSFLYRDAHGDVSLRLSPDGEGGLRKEVERPAGAVRSKIEW